MCGRIARMADPAPSPAALEERVASLADVVNKLIGVVSRVDDETSATAAAAFDSDVPRVAGHKATAEALKCLSDALDGWLKAWGASKAGEGSSRVVGHAGLAGDLDEIDLVPPRA